MNTKFAKKINSNCCDNCGKTVKEILDCAKTNDVDYWVLLVDKERIIIDSIKFPGEKHCLKCDLYYDSDDEEY